MSGTAAGAAASAQAASRRGVGVAGVAGVAVAPVGPVVPANLLDVAQLECFVQCVPEKFRCVLVLFLVSKSLKNAVLRVQPPLEVDVRGRWFFNGPWHASTMAKLDGLRHLAEKFPNIQTIFLRDEAPNGNIFSDNVCGLGGALMFAQNITGLTSLGLAGFDLELDALQALRTVLAQNTKLRRLALIDGSGALPYGPTYETLTTGLTAELKAMSNLTELVLKNSRMGVHPLDSILNALCASNCNLRKLDLRHVNPTGLMFKFAEVRTVLQCLTTLTDLDLSENSLSNNSADGVGVCLSHLVQLEILDIGKNPFDNRGMGSMMSFMTPLTLLRCLVLRRIPLHTAGIVNLCELMATCTNLTKLNLSACDIEDNGACYFSTTLVQLSKMQSLSLSHNTISNTGISSLANAPHPHLKDLDLSSNCFDNFEALLELSSLTRLDISYMQDAPNAQLGLRLRQTLADKFNWPYMRTFITQGNCPGSDEHDEELIGLLHRIASDRGIQLFP